MNLAEQVASLRRTLHRLFARRLGARTGRPFMQLQALNAIAGGEGCSQAALADRLLADAPAVSRLVDRLEEDGLLRRRQAEDRRKVCLEVTPAGQAELRVWREELRAVEEEMRRHLSPEEVEQLSRLVCKLHDGLRQGVHT